MRLSEAIRLGAMNTEQGFNQLRYKNKTCALGAAYDALGILDSVLNSTVGSYTFTSSRATVCPYETFPILLLEVEHPIQLSKDQVITAITNLNDVYKWTREAIADWVELKEVELGYYNKIEVEKCQHSQV